MTLNQTVHHKQYGTGTITAIDDKFVTVNFDNQEIRLLKAFAKFGKFKAKKQKKQPASDPKQKLYSMIQEIAEGNQSMRNLPIWSAIMEEADKQGHFASQIVEDALSRKPISKKQAWVVAFFADNNNLIK